MAKFRLTHSVIVTSPGLLPMLYTISELSQAVGVHDRTLRDWLQFYSVPHIRDENGRIWINGLLFAKWVNDVRKAKNRTKLNLAEGEAFCVTCRRAVQLEVKETRPIRPKLIIICGQCPRCGRTICRGIKSENLSKDEVKNEIS